MIESGGYLTISKHSAQCLVTCLVGVKLLVGAGDNFCAGEVNSIVLFSLPKSTNSLSHSRSEMAETI